MDRWTKRVFQKELRGESGCEHQTNYRLIYMHLGDNWLTVSWALSRSEEIGRTINLLATNEDQKRLLENLVQYFDSNGKVEIEMYKGERAITIDEYFISSMIFHFKKFKGSKTKMAWKENKNKIICYQFDGRYMAHLKNPPEADMPKLTSFLSDYKFVKIGLPQITKPAGVPAGTGQFLNEDINTICKSELFIGIDSGMSYVSISTGIPCFIIEYNFPLLYVGEKGNVICCHGTDDCIKKVKEYLKNRETHG